MKTSCMNIKIDDLSAPEVIGLLEEHLQHMIRVTPPGSVHALDIQNLDSPTANRFRIISGTPILSL